VGNRVEFTLKNGGIKTEKNKDNIKKNNKFSVQMVLKGNNAHTNKA